MMAGPFFLVDRLRFVDALDHLQSGKAEGWFSRLDHSPGFIVEALAMTAKDLGHLGCHGAVEEHFCLRNLPVADEASEVVEEFLGAFDGEDGDDDVSRPRRSSRVPPAPGVPPRRSIRYDCDRRRSTP